MPTEKLPLPPEKRKNLDIAVETRLAKIPTYLYFIFEHKAYPEKFTILQILYYILAVWEECLRKGKRLIPVIPLVFYHGEKPWIYPVKLSEFFEDVPEEVKRYLVKFEYLLFDTERIGDEELLKLIEFSNILVFGIYLMKNARRGKEFVVGGLKKFFSMVEEFSERHKIYFKEFMIYFMEVGRVDERDLENILLKEGGEKVRSILDKWFEEWYQKGIEKGIVQGLILDAQEMVLSAIEAKLGYVPDDVAKKVKETFDREKLREILKELIKEPSPEVVLKKHFLKSWK